MLTGRVAVAMFATGLALISSASVYASPILINTVSDLQNISNDLSGSYVLNANIDATATASWNGGAGFQPLGDSSTPFTGTLDGNGYSISNLVIDLPSATDVGLFGNTGATGLVENVNLTNANIIGLNNTGALAGTNQGAILNANVTGTVSGSVISSNGFTSDSTGGLVGYNVGNVSNSSASVQVVGGQLVGGLVGNNASTGTIFQSSASGSVSSAQDAVGGLVGGNNGAIQQSFATGNVNSSVYGAGGLVGGNGVGATIVDSYATGNASAVATVGGLVGANNATVTTSYSTGLVTGAGSVGGLAGITQFGGTVTNSYWDTQTSGQVTSAGGTGLTTAQLTSGSLPSGFGSAVWLATPGQTPALLWQSAPTVGQLANINVDMANPLPVGTNGYAAIGAMLSPDGLFVRIYANPNSSQIVFAIAGTNVLNPKNDLVDATLWATTSSALLNSYVTEAAQYLETVIGEHSSANITLTGYSLGGALAQLLGKASGAATVVFNAPGTANIYPLYASTLASELPKLGGGVTNVNYRAFGDQISAFGKQLGTVFTVGNSGGPNSESEFLSGWHPGGIDYTTHDISPLAADLQPASTVQVQAGLLGPNYTNSVLVLGVLLYGVEEYVSAYDHYFIDPSGSSQFTVESNPGSPFFNSLELPTLSDVSYYDLQYEIGNIWSDAVNVDGGETYDFEPGVSSFEFETFDQSGDPIATTDPFFFDVTFASSGDFSGSITESSVPEPASLFLVLSGLGLLGGLGGIRRQSSGS